MNMLLNGTNQMVQIKWYKSFKYIQIWSKMAKNGLHVHIWATVFWPSLSRFWVSWTNIFYGGSGDYYLLTSDIKSYL